MRGRFQPADLGLDEDGEASHGNAPHAAVGRLSRMPQSRNQSSPPPSAGGRDIAVAQRRDLFWPPFFNPWISSLLASPTRRWGPCVFPLRELVMDGELAICFGFMCGVAGDGDGSR
jgi:hypothetical protein